jgi:hypothetical protein
MSPAHSQKLTEQERLLLLATYLQGPRPHDGPHANCGRVLRQALVWAGLWNEQLKRDEGADIDNPVIDEWYDILIRMTRHEPASEALIEGFGNLGDEDMAPFPRYTACHLTERGRNLAEQLFTAYPQYRSTPVRSW